MDTRKIEQLVDEFNEKIRAEFDSSNLGKILNEIHYKFHHDMIDTIYAFSDVVTKYEAWKKSAKRKTKKQKSKEVF